MQGARAIGGTDSRELIDVRVDDSISWFAARNLGKSKRTAIVVAFGFAPGYTFLPNP